MTEDALPSSPALERVEAGNLCSGCGLCASLGGAAIEMIVSKDGYNRPRQNAPIPREVDEAIAHTCPGLEVEPWDASEATHPYWGPYRAVLTGHATDAELRHRASSGGALSALLIHALESKQIDAVLHIDADPDHPTRNITIVSRTPAAIADAEGSRYAPSSPLTDIESILGGSERWAVVAKPCDASALRRLAARDPRVNDRIVLILSFFCGGIPSHGGISNILDALDVAQDDLARYRYRGNGWPGFATALRHDGSSAQMSYMDSWGRHLSPTVQYRCKICPDAVGGVADLACGDAWHGDDAGYPVFEELDGRSLIVTRSAAGEALVASARAAGALRTEPLAIGAIDAMQPGQVRRKRALLARLMGAAAAGEHRFRPRGLGVVSAARRASARETIRNFIGTFSRVRKRRKIRGR